MFGLKELNCESFYVAKIVVFISISFRSLGLAPLKIQD